MLGHESDIRSWQKASFKPFIRVSPDMARIILLIIILILVYLFFLPEEMKIRFVNPMLTCVFAWIAGGVIGIIIWSLYNTIKEINSNLRRYFFERNKGCAICKAGIPETKMYKCVFDKMTAYIQKCNTCGTYWFLDSKERRIIEKDDAEFMVRYSPDKKAKEILIDENHFPWQTVGSRRNKPTSRAAKITRPRKKKSKVVRRKKMS
jgi:hypothetical protein